MARKTLQELIDAGDVMGALSLEGKRQGRAIAGAGGKMFPNLLSIASIWGQARKNKADKPPEKEDPPLPPTDGSGDGTTPTSAKPKSNSWPDIVAFNFPEGARKQYKDGGLVRGGGKATKGRGRGRMV